MRKKKVNPHRIPLPKNAVDKDAIIEESMKDDMAHGWLLVASALSDLGYDNISELSDAVNRFIETGSALDDETKNIQKKNSVGISAIRSSEIPYCDRNVRNRSGAKLAEIACVTNPR